MKKKEMNDLLTIVQNFSAEEQEALVNNILAMMQDSKKGKGINLCSDFITDARGEIPDCPHCGAKASMHQVIKKGFKENGAQRYFCKECNKYYIATTNTAFQGTHKKSALWKKFIYLTITGATLHECADECKIAYRTAFTWRHKILNVFAIEQDVNTNMTGTIEMDEMLIPISYKGNHIEGKFGEDRSDNGFRKNNMPRPGFKRGSDNKPKSSKERVCVCCLVEDGNKSFYASTPGVGFMVNPMLSMTLGKHVDKTQALMLVDEYKVTRNYLEDNGYAYRSLKSNVSDNSHDHKPEIDGGYHLQHVNALHSHLRGFLRKYHGVSSKYLNNYISMFIWIKNVSTKNKKHLRDISVSRASFSDCYISEKELKAFPPIPAVA